MLPLAAAALALPAGAQTAVRPVVITTVAGLPVSAEDGRPYMVTDALSSSDCTTGGGTEVALCAYDVSAAAYVALSGGGGSGDITDVGDCATGACFSSVTARHALLGPVGGGTATFRALVEADISDLSHTVDTDNQTGTEVPYTPTTGTDWTDPDPVHAAEGLDDLAGRLTIEEAKADDDVPESGDFGAATDLEADGSLSIDVVAPAEMADADHGDVSWSAGVATVDSGAVGVTELADDGLCDANEVVARNAGDTAFECQASGGAPAGSDRQVQFNDAGSFGASSGLVYDANSVFTLTYPGTGWPFGRAMRISNAGQTLDIFNAGVGGQASLNSSLPIAFGPQGSGTQTVTMYSWGTLFNLKRADGVHSATCSDSGDANPGALTIAPTTSCVEITNADADGCTITISESAAQRGESVEFVVVANAGGTVNFADTPGVTELAGAFAAGLWDSLTLRYASDRYIESGRSDN